MPWFDLRSALTPRSLRLCGQFWAANTVKHFVSPGLAVMVGNFVRKLGNRRLTKAPAGRRTPKSCRPTPNQFFLDLDFSLPGLLK